MNYEQKFEQAEAAGVNGAFQRVDETHPVSMFLGIEDGQRAVMVVCETPPCDLPSMAAINVDAKPRHDGGWALVLRLARTDLKVLFTRLVEDLDGATRNCSGDPGKVVVARLAKWQRLLSRGAAGVLEEHELRGLAAELGFLLSEALDAVGSRAAVAAWVGPHDAPKDFVFDRVEVEVKAVRRQQRAITISSLEQLTDAGLPLYLWTRVVEMGVGAQGDTHSFAALVARVRAAVAHDSLAAEGLESGLRAIGYEDRPEYEARTVRFGTSACFLVSAGFPRLQVAQVPKAVVACRYEIAVAELESFKASTWRGALIDGR